MVLRIEDLDPRAKNAERARLVIEDLKWLGLDWDEGPYYQSERIDAYNDALEKLAERGLVYPCFCTRSELHAASAPHASDGTYVYGGTCRNLTSREIAEKSLSRQPAARLRVPEADDPSGMICFDDLGYGRRREVLAQDCGDFLVRRSDGVIAYQLAVAVDDCLMGVNQVVRGRDLLSSSARQIYLARLLGFDPPHYGHVPLLVASDGRRLAKRDRDMNLGELQEVGIRPEDIIGRMAQALDLAGRGEAINAAEFARRFSWQAIRDHRNDVTVDEFFSFSR